MTGSILPKDQAWIKAGAVHLRSAHADYLGQAQEALSQAQLYAELLSRLEQRTVAILHCTNLASAHLHPKAHAKPGDADSSEMSSSQACEDQQSAASVIAPPPADAPPLRSQVLRVMRGDLDRKWSAAELAEQLHLESDRSLRVLLDKMVSREQVTRLTGSTQRAVR